MFISARYLRLVAQLTLNVDKMAENRFQQTSISAFKSYNVHLYKMVTLFIWPINRPSIIFWKSHQSSVGNSPLTSFSSNFKPSAFYLYKIYFRSFGKLFSMKAFNGPYAEMCSISIMDDFNLRSRRVWKRFTLLLLYGLCK